MDIRLRRVLTAVLVGFVLGFAIALANGQSLLISFHGGLVLTAVAGVLAAPLIWAVEIAEKKGYGVWFGVLMVLLLNALGLLLLLMLPQKIEDQKQRSYDV